MVVYTKCSNYASDTCPCVLAENGHCIVCPMCRGEDFCDCPDTVSFCILQELKNNGGHAKKPHEAIPCSVVHVKKYGDVLRLIRLRIPEGDHSAFRRLGCYVFVRVNENPYFDVPISVLNDGYDSDTIGLLIEIRGIKTGYFSDIGKGDTVYLRGPYYNGLQGLRNVSGFHDGKALVLCRGIGFLPSVQVIETLRSHNNELTVYLDPSRFDRHILDLFNDLFEIQAWNIRICDEKGELTEACVGIIEDAIKNGTGLIHLGLSDYLIGKCGKVIEEQKYEAALSFINNAHICCGEGICGACTVNIGPNRIIHHCKDQFTLDEAKKLLGGIL